VLIIRRSKFYYTASGIITLCRWPSGALRAYYLNSSYFLPIRSKYFHSILFPNNLNQRYSCHLACETKFITHKKGQTSQFSSYYSITILRYVVSTLIISNVNSAYFSNLSLTYSGRTDDRSFFMILFVYICYSETFHSDLHNDNLPVAQGFRRY